MYIMKYPKIMLAGPSGIGKTTISKWISEAFNLEFLSGSMSDLLPQTAGIPHKDMLSRTPEELFQEDFQVMNLRNKLYKDKDNFVTDRSYLDSASYCLYKQASKLPACEVGHFIETAKMLLNIQCDLLILFDFVPDLLHKWVTEDNNKRITSNFFQIEIASIMRTTLDIMGYREEYNATYIGTMFKQVPLKYGFSVGNIASVYGTTKVLIIREMNLDLRKDIITTFLKK